MTHLVDFVRSNFEVKDCQAAHLQMRDELKQAKLDLSDYIRKFYGSCIFWKEENFENLAVYIYFSGLRSKPLRADFVSPY